MKKNVRLIDIGKELGVSAVTVSNALSNQKGVSEELREKIVQKAKELGYSNSQINIKKEPSISVGVIISGGYLDKYATFYWDAYQRLSIKAIEHNCITIVEIIKEEDIDEKTIPLIVKEDKVQALIIMGEVPSAYLLNLKNNINIPMIFMDFYKKNIQDIDCVISNNFYGMYFLTNEVIKKGHRDLLYVGTINSVASVTDRYFGFMKAVSENEIPLTESMSIPDRKHDSPHIKVSLPDRIPSAFVCNCDLVAAMITEKLRDRGYRVPEDVSVVGFDNYLFPGLSNMEFTTYDVNIDEMIDTALSIVNKRVGKKSTARPRIYITCGKIVERKSLIEKKITDAAP